MDIKYLIEQFKRATGVTYFDYHDKDCQKELIEWIATRRKMGSVYGMFLDNFGRNIDRTTCAEVSKSSHDSIILSSKTTMITPYNHDLAKNGQRLILPVELKIYEGIPAIEVPTEDGRKGLVMISPESIDTYITQNPYTREHLASWENLHNRGTNVIVGVYGNVSDKDKEEKLRMLRSFRGKLEGYSKEEYGVKNDGYYYAIISNRYKTLSKTLTMHR